jgi:hypothetical protein
MASNKSVLLLVGLLLPISHFYAAPDPDIFDGRQPQQSSPQTPTPADNETAAGGEEAAANASTPEPEASVGTGDAAAAPAAPEPQTETAEGTAGAPETVAERSFEGLDQIGGEPVAHPGAPELPEPSRETASSGGAGTAEARGSAGTEATEGGAAAEVRTFEGLDVGGKTAREQQIEVRRSIELRPVPEPGRRPVPPSSPEAGGASSPPGQRAPAEEGSEIPAGL